MIDGVQLKFCGLRTLVDAEMADRLGADYLGFIFHEASPRGVTLRDFQSLEPNLPEDRKRVAVVVEPDADRLNALRDVGFDRFQIHFRADTPPERLDAWTRAVGRSYLWLAPKRPPGVPFDPSWKKHAATFLVDTFAADRFGGSGETGDWAEFRELRENHSDAKWILAGGLSPTNIGGALAATDARMVDVNSGVELAPGIKDHLKMRGVVLAIHRARQQPRQPAHE